MFVKCLLLVSVLWKVCESQDLYKVALKFQEMEALQNAAANRYQDSHNHDDPREELAGDALRGLWTTTWSEVVASNHTISRECFHSTESVLTGNVTISMPPNRTVSVPRIAILIDATGKLEPGMLSGNFLLNGAFDECFKYDFTAYCMGKVNLSSHAVPLGWNAGLCVPKHCSAMDVAILMNFTRIFNVSANEMKCTDSKFPDYDAGAIVMIVVCAIFGLLVCASTIFHLVFQQLGRPSHRDGYMRINSSKEKAPLLHTVEAKQPRVQWHEFLTVFSLYKTVPTLLATKQASGVITSLNGLRVISMFWVILGHCYVWVLPSLNNPTMLMSIVRRFSFQPLLTGVFSVDSFFFLSGVLVAYLTLRQMKKRKGRFPLFHYYVHRYLRLTPTYAFVLFFAWLLSGYLAAGPLLSLTDGYGPACRKYWWTNLLYINNLYPWKMGDQCVGWTWYLANDMQFFVISPLILIPAYFLLPVGMVINFAFLICSFVATGVLMGVYQLPATVQSIDLLQKYMNLIYEKPWSRIQPYLVGLALGYILYRGIHLPFKRATNWLLYLMVWVIAGVCLALPVYGLYPSYRGHTLSVAENVLYATFTRFTWGLGLALLVFACHNGYGGLINTFLSMKLWTPLSRMTFNAYLVHPVILTIIYGQLQTSVHMTDLTMATFVVGLVVLSYGVAGVLCVMVEFPLGSLEMLLFKLLGLDGRGSLRHDTNTQKKPTDEVEKILTGGSSEA